MEGLNLNSLEKKKEYDVDSILDFIDDLENKDESSITETLECGLESDEALEFIKKYYMLGKRPMVTVPTEFIGESESGMVARPGWDPEESVIAGTFGIEAYNSEDRSTFRIGVGLDRVRPRMTGSDNRFHGVVTIDGPVLQSEMEIINENLN